MPRRASILASLSCLAILAMPAAAGDWRSGIDDPVIVLHETLPWHSQPPHAGTGPGYYYSQHPDHIPAWPKPLAGYAVPIFDMQKPVVHHRPYAATHEEWCAARYRSYDPYSNSWQPRHGPRRLCRSPFP